MKKVFKISLIVISTLIIAGALAVLVLFNIVRDAFGPECEEYRTWVIGEYKIQQKKCLAFVGPHYYPTDLYKDDVKIDKWKFKKDSCNFRFRPEDELYLNFDVCDKTVEEIRANKIYLDINQVTKVEIKNNDSGETNSLNQASIKEFVENWNQSTVDRYTDQKPIFYPSDKYEIMVTMRNQELTFYGLDYLVADQNGWIYFMADQDTTYFAQLMNNSF